MRPKPEARKLHQLSEQANMPCVIGQEKIKKRAGRKKCITPSLASLSK
jgi:hypothetical protein